MTQVARLLSHVLGLPRIGARRELKKALENYWTGQLDQQGLFAVGKTIRRANRRLQHDAGLHFVTVGDFTYYDQVLKTSLLVGNVPKRFGVHDRSALDIDDLFRMARGRAPRGKPTPACEMTKWFDTNYHYIVPEFSRSTTFELASQMLFDEVREGLAETPPERVKPVLIGPITYLYLGKARDTGFDKFSLLPELLEVYISVLRQLHTMGITWVQLDEPILSLDLTPKILALFPDVYEKLKQSGVGILLANYFGYLGENLDTVLSLPIDALHIDAIRGDFDTQRLVDTLPPRQISLSYGIVEGRNIWRDNMRQSLATLHTLHKSLGERLIVASACSLLHVPYDLDMEQKLDPVIRSWLAFAVQKCHEVGLLAEAVIQPGRATEEALQAADAAVQGRATSTMIHDAKVQQAILDITPSMYRRASSYPERVSRQRDALHLPLFPTTTIGSFPQTPDIRQVRRRYRLGEINEDEYVARMREQISDAVERQTAIGLDVLVHGEPERNDMVEYFGEQLKGFAFTANGWVQSYGSRCVKPPIIYGDVSRSRPMTVEWSRYAQSLTSRPVKGMLTGAITILCWSFARDDLARSDICKQIALAMRQEVIDLERAGIRIIQIDEPAIREALPLRAVDRTAYLKWAVESFHLTADGVCDATQIHTHMCYSEFNDMLDSVAALDADVISIEASRSNLELLEAFEDFDYPNEIGPGVYDIHSPNVPESAWIVDVLKRAAQKIPKERLWLNPDCGLKTRQWQETTPSLRAMVDAARQLRVELA